MVSGNVSFERSSDRPLLSKKQCQAINTRTFPENHYSIQRHKRNEHQLRFIGAPRREHETTFNYNRDGRSKTAKVHRPLLNTINHIQQKQVKWGGGMRSEPPLWEITTYFTALLIKLHGSTVMRNFHTLCLSTVYIYFHS